MNESIVSKPKYANDRSAIRFIQMDFHGVLSVDQQKFPGAGLFWPKNYFSYEWALVYIPI